MNGFIVTAPAEPATETPIASGPFWPDIDPAEQRIAQRIDNTVTAERLRMALIEAIATTNYALRAFRIEQLDLGRSTLANVPCDEIDGENVLVHRYRRAVGCLAKALLLERQRDFDATGKGDKKAEDLSSTIDDCRRDHLHALSDITGKPRTVVELI